MLPSKTVLMFLRNAIYGILQQFLRLVDHKSEVRNQKSEGRRSQYVNLLGQVKTLVRN
jgi:hypothetical protein